MLFYDEIGNLIGDKSENITNIEWSIYGKVLSVTKRRGAKITEITYQYDATGNRVHKTVDVHSTGFIQTGGKSINVVYWRDAQGNVLNTVTSGYEQQMPGEPSINKAASEFVIYGSSRLGTYSPEYQVYSLQFLGITKNTLTLGYKAYELSNHLGNVLTTISDNYTITPPSGVGGLVRVLSSQDYYPFGMVMTERSFVEKVDRKYRFGFNGKEEDFDMSEGMLDFGARGMDSRICRFTSVDPLAAKYPSISPFVFVMNMPLIAIDPKGKDVYLVANIHINHIDPNDGSETIETRTELIKLTTANHKAIKQYLSMHGSPSDIILYELYVQAKEVPTGKSETEKYEKSITHDVYIFSSPIPDMKVIGVTAPDLEAKKMFTTQAASERILESLDITNKKTAGVMRNEIQTTFGGIEGLPIRHPNRKSHFIAMNGNVLGGGQPTDKEINDMENGNNADTDDTLFSNMEKSTNLSNKRTNILGLIHEILVHVTYSVTLRIPISKQHKVHYLKNGDSKEQGTSKNAVPSSDHRKLEKEVNTYIIK